MTISIRWFFLFFFLFVTILSSSRASSIGVGATLGQPTGGVVRFWHAENRGIDIGAGMTLLGGNNFTLHSNYIWNKQEVFYTENNKPLDVYYGAGLRMKFADDIHMGLRLPLGVGYYNTDRTIEWFGELAPIFDFTPRAKTEMHVIAGVRFYLGE
jgi:hypothetical protein